MITVRLCFSCYLQLRFADRLLIHIRACVSMVVCVFRSVPPPLPGLTRRSSSLIRLFNPFTTTIRDRIASRVPAHTHAVSTALAATDSTSSGSDLAATAADAAMDSTVSAFGASDVAAAHGAGRFLRRRWLAKQRRYLEDPKVCSSSIFAVCVVFIPQLFTNTCLLLSACIVF